MALRVLFSNADFGGCGYYRCLLPAKTLREKNLAEAETSIVLSFDYLKYFDLIILQRSCNPGILDFVKKAKEMRRPLIYELDDDLFSIPYSNPAYGFYTKEKKKNAIEIMKACDALIVTTPYLADKLKRYGYNKNIFVIPNFLDKELWENKKKKKNDCLFLGWAGTQTHYDDLLPILPIVKQARKSYDIKLIFIGWNPPDIEADEFIPFSHYENYVENLAKIDIGLAPIIDNQFNRSKSYVKILEYNGLGIPCIASKVENYKIAYSQGAGCVLAKSPKDWIRWIHVLVSNPSAREKISQRGKEWVSKNWIQDNIFAWLDVFGFVMENYSRAEEQFPGVSKPECIDTVEKYEKIKCLYDENGRRKEENRP